MRLDSQLLRVKLLLVFLVIFGAKLYVVHQFGSPVPYYDQWTQEAAGLFKPMQTGSFPWAHLLQPTGEHRILFYGLLSTSLFKVNQQWDVLLELTANALVNAVLGVALAAMLVRVFKGQWANAILAAVVMVYALPIAWNSMVIVMNVQYLLQILFSVLALRYVLLHPAFSVQWILGMAMAGCALYTSGAGMLGAAAIVFTQSVEAFASRKITRKTIFTMGAASVILFAGLFLLLSAHSRAEAKAESAKAFAVALLKNMSWPFIENYWLGVLLYLPLALLFFLCIFRRRDLEQSESLLIGLGAYVLINMAAIAYARGGAGDPPAVRYLDLHVVGALVNIGSVLELARGGFPAQGLLGKALPATCAAWLTLIFSGLAVEASRVVTYELPHFNAKQVEQLKNTRAYLLSGDPKILTDCPPSERPFDTAEVLIGLLNDPVVRGFLPPELQPAISLKAIPATGAAFKSSAVPPQATRNDTEKVWGSFGSPDAVFRSEPVSVHLPYIQFEVAGYKTKVRMAGKNGKSSRVVLTEAANPSLWQTAWAKIPDQQFSVQAEDPGEGRWFAFTEPRELPKRCYQIRRLLENSGIVFFGALIPLGFLFLKDGFGLSRRTA